jgi:hypothetical protein
MSALATKTGITRNVARCPLLTDAVEKGLVITGAT